MYLVSCIEWISRKILSFRKKLYRIQIGQPPINYLFIVAFMFDCTDNMNEKLNSLTDFLIYFAKLFPLVSIIYYCTSNYEIYLSHHNLQMCDMKSKLFSAEIHAQEATRCLQKMISNSSALLHLNGREMFTFSRWKSKRFF